MAKTPIWYGTVVPILDSVQLIQYSTNGSDKETKWIINSVLA